MDNKCSAGSSGSQHKKEMIKELLNQVEKNKNSDGDNSLSGRSSPEPNCPICLGKPTNKSFTDSCLHLFCFTCILEWSKVKAECPLCKQIFKSIIHNIRSLDDYDEHRINNPHDRLMQIFNVPHYDPERQREPFRYRTTAVSSYLNYFVRLEEAITNHVIPSINTRSSTPPIPVIIRNTTSEFRRNVYQQGLWVQPTRDITGRVRDCSPEFYRENPALLHRLVPWLNRELNVLCNANDPHVQYVMSRILELITQTPIRSPTFIAAVSTYLGRHTEHFVHEFYSFASSPYDLVAYDRYASYVGYDSLAHEMVSDDDNDSDVQILVGPTPTSPTRSIHLDDSDSDDCVVLDSIPPHREVPEIITLESDPDDDVVQVNIHIGTDNSRSSPSHRPALKRKWLTVKNVQMEKHSNDNVNVSINIAHSSRTRSPSSDDDSSSSWTPSIIKSKTSTKIKETLIKKKKLSKKKCSPKSTSKNKSKAKLPNKVYKGRSPSPVMKRKSRAIKIQSSSEDEIDKRSTSVSDYYSSSNSSDVSVYRPRLRSVVFKSTVKSETCPSSPAVSGSYWNECSHDYNYNSDTDRYSRNKEVDIHRPSCSHQNSRRRRYSSSSSEYIPEYKYKYSKKTSKRRAH